MQMISRVLPALAVALAACPAISDADLGGRMDRDGDGYQSSAYGGPDCNDDDEATHPGAREVCDGVDNDCDALVNAEDPGMSTEEVEWILDADGDGYGTDDVIVRTCATLVGYVHVGGDCDDTDAEEFPGQVWFLDGDGDGFGLADRPRTECARPDAHAIVSGDCNDANKNIFPTAPEICNGSVDDDCDLMTDEEDDDVVDATLVFVDADDDDYGDDATADLTCADDLTGRAIVGGDCNDADGNVHPGASDPPYVGGDSNCSGDSDWDQDGDGHDLLGGDTAGDDCDDLREWVYPGAQEVCDDAPNDCTDPLVWDETLEDGLAHFVPIGISAPIDWTSTLTTGGVVQIAEAGTLYVCGQPLPGPDWTGRIEITGGDVELVAARGAGTSILDTSSLASSNVIALGATTIVKVDGLTFVGGTGANSGVSTVGGCLLADTVSSVTLKDTAFVGCTADVGGGAAMAADSILVDACFFDSNDGVVGGGLFLQSTTNATIFGSVITNNDAVSGGGVFFAEWAGAAPTTILAGSIVSGNVADTGGGAYIEVDLAMGSTEISDNNAGLGGGIFVRSLQAPAVTCDPKTTFARNATYAIAVQRGTFTADACDLSSGVDDNTHADIWTGNFGFEYIFDGPTSIQCSQSGCF